VTKRTRLITLGLVTFFLGVVLFFPARVAYQWFAPPAVRISGISGSLWYGSASEAMVNDIYMRELQWRIHPLELVTATLNYAVRTKLATGFVEADVGVRITGTIIISDLSASTVLSNLQSVTGVPGLQGNVSAQFSRIVLKDGLPLAADGIVEVAGLVVPLVQRESIGGFKAEFLTQDSGIAASVEDTDALVDLAASLQLSADRSYRFLGQLSARPDTPAALRQQMQFLGSANARGQHELRFEGTL
jgi:general secretion pathway protein N